MGVRSSIARITDVSIDSKYYDIYGATSSDTDYKQDGTSEFGSLTIDIN